MNKMHTAQSAFVFDFLLLRDEDVCQKDVFSLKIFDFVINSHSGCAVHEIMGTGGTTVVPVKFLCSTQMTLFSQVGYLLQPPSRCEILAYN